MKLKTTILLSVPYVAIALLCTKLGQGWRLSEGATASDKLPHLTDGMLVDFLRYQRSMFFLLLFHRKQEVATCIAIIAVLAN